MWTRRSKRISLKWYGLNDKKLQESLLTASNLDSNKTVEICRVLEVTRSQAHVIQHNSAVNPDYNVDEIRKQFSNNQKSQKESPDLIKKCKFCSFSHKRGAYPACGKLCNNCKKENHFAKCCNVKNAITSMFTIIRIIPNLRKIAKVLKMKLYLEAP